MKNGGQAVAVRFPEGADEVIRFAASELASGLAAMLGAGSGVTVDGDVTPRADSGGAEVTVTLAAPRRAAQRR